MSAAKCLHVAFEAQVERTPDAVAVEDETESLTYRELDRRANRLAHRLRAMGVGRETRVAVALPRSADAVVAFLGILKAGGAYVPVDPAYPVESTRFMVEDSGATALVTRRREKASLPAGRTLETIHLDELTGDEDRVPNVVDGSALAYVIYTSGSTGRPKGVLIEHAAVCKMAESVSEIMRITPGSRQIWLTSISFDASVAVLYMTLLYGGGVFVAGPDDLGPELVAFCKKKKITHAVLPPSVWSSMPADETLPDLRVGVTTGEACTPEIVGRWAKGRTFINGYGPTENTVATTMGVCIPDGKKPSIGPPIGGVTVHILDEAMRPVPKGETGEIYCGGELVARGYHERPELTAERFVPDPFSGVPGARLYRTGDLGRFRPDGEVDFVGRRDGQIKIRGFRVELGEIESALAEHPAIRQAVVVARGEHQKRRLVAYFVPASPVTTAELREFMVRRVPHFMVPSSFVSMTAFALTPNKKIDREALPEAPEPDASSATPPSTDMEKLVATQLAEVLDAPVLDVHAQLADLGLTSIGGASLRLLLSRAGFPATAADLQTYPTVAELAAFLTKSGAEVLAKVEIAAADRERVFQGDVEDAYPLADIQKLLLLSALSNPEKGAWNVQCAVTVDGPIDAALFRDAIRTVIARHPALRTSFQWLDVSEPVQRVHREPRFEWEHLAWKDLAPDEFRRRLVALQDRMIHTTLELDRAPIFLAALVDAPDGSHELLWTSHHIVMDGWSVRVMMREIFDIYEASAKGKEAPLVPPVPYRRHVEWLRSQKFEADLAFWSRELAGVTAAPPFADERPAAPPGPPLAEDDPRRAVLAKYLPNVDLLRCHPRHTVEALLPASVVASLEAAAKRRGVTIGTLIHAAWALTVMRAASRDEIVIGFTVMARRDLVAAVGLFLNRLTLRAQVKDDATIAAWISAFGAHLQELNRYEFTPVPVQNRAAGLPRGSALCAAELTFNDLRNVGPAGAVLRTRNGRLASESLSKTPTLNAVLAETLNLEIEYEAVRFDHAAMMRLLHDLVSVVDALHVLSDDAPMRRVLELPRWDRGSGRLGGTWGAG